MSAVRPSSRALRHYTLLVIAVGGGVLAHSLYLLPSAPYPLGWAALGVLALLAAAFPLKVPGLPAYLSINETFFMASALLFGPAPATVTIAVDSLIISWRRGNHLRQLLFNLTSAPLALWCGIHTYFLMSGGPPMAHDMSSPNALTLAPLAGMAGVYFLLNSGLIALAVALSKGIRPFQLWRQHFLVMSLNYFGAASAAFFLIVLMQSLGVTALVAVIPLISVCYLAMRSWLGRVEDAQQHVQTVNKMYLSTIGAFSTAIEAKDGVTGNHVHRVQAYALGLARALDVTDASTLQAIEAAALLHDTGKLAVPEHILNKPGRLTPAEFETMKTHVDVGAEILSSIDFPYPVVPIVRAHHENWDGTGYPRNLKAEDIPIGARILAVVDCFDALTSDRPYRAAMNEADAIAIIVERRGTMYDPQVVDTFLKVYRDIAPPGAQKPALENALRQIRRVHQPEPAEAVSRLPDASGDASTELLAFVSLARVASQRPTVRDIGALAWAHLRELVPTASLAIFTTDSARTELLVEYAAGPAAPRLGTLSMEVGRRVSGWVAANRRPMMNADAPLDLAELAEDLRYALSLPLLAEARLVGVLTLYAVEQFSDVQVRQLEMIVPHLATAVAAVDNEPARPAGRDLRVVARR